MAPLTWKLLLSTATLAGGQQCTANDSCEDQTALLQSHLASHKSTLASAESQAQMLNFPKMSTLADPSQRHTALAQFEHTALELAQNSASVTPEVVQVCQMTTELLTDTVLSAIVSEHDTDQASLDSRFDIFATIEADRQVKETAILAAAAGVGMNWETDHWVKSGGGCAADVIQCFEELSVICVTCFGCRETCTTHWTECEDCGAELEVAHTNVITTLTEHSAPHCVNGAVTPPSSTTYTQEVTTLDHRANEEAMLAYIALIGQCETCESEEVTNCQYESCNILDPTDCTTETCSVIEPVSSESPPPADCAEHITKRGECETLKASCQEGQGSQACAASVDVALLLTLYQEQFGQSVVALYQEMGRVELTEADRKVEWDTLERVICLLNTLTNDEDGSASSSTTEGLIQACQDDTIPRINTTHVGIGTDHLIINYPVAPDPNGLPTMPPTPCDDEFDAITCVDHNGALPPLCDGDQTIIDIFYPPPQPLPAPCVCEANPPTPQCDDGTLGCLIDQVYPAPYDGTLSAHAYAATDQQRAAVASMMVAPPFAVVPPPPYEYRDQESAPVSTDAR